MGTSRVRAVSLGLAVGVVAAVLVMALGRAMSEQTTLGLHLRSQVCLTAPGAAKGDGVCVQRWTRPELLIVSGQDQVRVYPASGGTLLEGRFYEVPDPFAGAGATVATAYTSDGAVELSSSGVAAVLRFPAARLAALTS